MIIPQVTRSMLLLGCYVGAATCAEASDTPDSDPAAAIVFGGPSSIVGQIDADREPKESLLDRDRVTRPLRELTDRMRSDYGVTLGLDYNALFQYASESLDKQNAAGGALRSTAPRKSSIRHPAIRARSSSRSKTVID